MKKNQVLEGQVTDMTFEGKGVVKFDGYPLFVDNALLGERVKIRVLKTGKSFGYAKVEAFLTRSENRLSVSEEEEDLRRGIADLAHMTYEAQLSFKENQVKQTLDRYLAGKTYEILPIIGAATENRQGYRNKASVPVQEKKGQLELGIYRKRTHELIPLEDYYLQDKKIDQVLNFLKELLRQHKVSVYDEKARRGALRHLVVRRGANSGELMVVFVLSQPISLNSVVAALKEKFPELVSVMQNLKKDRGNAIYGSDWSCLFGRNYLTDQMLGKTFQISAPAFYQVNTAQAEKLYEVAYDFAELKAKDIVLDAYSGIGTIGIGLAGRVSKVYGMEINAQAVSAAKKNAQLNGFDNVNYRQGTADRVLPDLINEGVKFDSLFVDPPRKGLESDFIGQIGHSGAKRLIYISCNPESFARNAVLFEKEGYHLDKVQPVDLFAQTHHIELVASFKKGTKF